jgi:hypothetical protein
LVNQLDSQLNSVILKILRELWLIETTNPNQPHYENKAERERTFSHSLELNDNTQIRM